MNVVVTITFIDDGDGCSIDELITNYILRELLRFGTRGY